MLAEKYESIFERTPELTLVSVDTGIGRLAAKLRAVYALRTPGALHLATAMIHGADFFLTNDHGFRKIDPTGERVPELVFIAELLS